MTRKAYGRKDVVVAAADEEAELAHGGRRLASRKRGMESPTLPSTRCGVIRWDDAGIRGRGIGKETRGQEKQKKRREEKRKGRRKE